MQFRTVRRHQEQPQTYILTPKTGWPTANSNRTERGQKQCFSSQPNSRISLLHLCPSAKPPFLSQILQGTLAEFVCLDKDLSLKEHINFICKIAFLELRRINTIRHYLTIDATETALAVSLVLSRIDYCNSLLIDLPQTVICNFKESKTVQPVLYSVLLQVFTPSSDSSTGCPSKLESPIKLHVSRCFNAITSSTVYLSDLKELYSPSRSLLSSADTPPSTENITL